MAGILVLGTNSDAGKSTVAVGLCRVFRRRGISVAPFKAQNMSNNSMVCRDLNGELVEIGRAQWIQALAASVSPDPRMNPVLLKPGSDHRSHVVVWGKPAGAIGAKEFAGDRRALSDIAYTAFDELATDFDVVVAEGAGSPAEINLRAGDFVNLGLAQHADLPAVLVGDIDRGGVFAALYGTLALLAPADRERIRGFIINRFRGDSGLLKPGLREISARTGRPVFGVLPWHSELWMDSEDSLASPFPETNSASAVRVAVVRFPRISNFTDVDALALEPDVDVRFVSSPRDITDTDLVILPGTRATVSDLDWLRRRGLDVAIGQHVRRGGLLLGICGGAQMLGTSISDPDGVESPPGTCVDGLGWVNASTTFSADKTLNLPTGQFDGVPVSGYEIHHGRLSVKTGMAFPGGLSTGRVFATMWHGLMECDTFRAMFLEKLSPRTSVGVNFTEARERRLDTIADLIEEHLDVSALVDLARSTAPRVQPTTMPGGE